MFRPLHALLATPSLVFLATLTVVLFRPPDLDLGHLDRFTFALLVVVVLLRAALLQQRIFFVGSVSWPMAGLLALAVIGALTQPFQAQTWSLLAAKFLVPFTLFHLAAMVFDDEHSQRQFETFALVALAYLCFIAIASLLGATALIYPRYILDESLGIHADRARGPFLQAVANGVAINLLGLLAFNAYRRGRLHGVLALVLLATLPMAILATMTRAVWLSFAVSIGLMPFLTKSARLWRVCFSMAAVATIGLVLASGAGRFRAALEDRLEERSPVEFRMAIYQVSWEMIGEKPLLGWGQNQMPVEIARRMADYRPDTYCAHNSYLEILVEQGAIGLLLYGWIIVGLFRVGRRKVAESQHSGTVFDQQFRSLWPILLAVYFVNSLFVVMNYQFVNALLFTLAGILAGQNRRLTESPPDVVSS